MPWLEGLQSHERGTLFPDVPDLTDARPGIERDEYGSIARVRVSARTGEGLDLLRESLAEYARAKADARNKEIALTEYEVQHDYIN